MHRFTHALALLMIGGAVAKSGDDYEPVADAIEVTLKGYPDEQKADLYALLAEAIEPTMPFETLCRVIHAALVTNDMAFIR